MKVKIRVTHTVCLWILCALTAFACLTAVGLRADAPTADAAADGTADTTLVGVELAPTYRVGQTVEIPRGILHFGGKSQIAVHEVVCPSGKSLRSSTVTIEEAGQYQVFYRATVDNKFCWRKITFVGIGALFSVEGQGGSAVFGAHPYAPKTKGIVVKLARGNTFVYNKAIDLKDRTATDNLLRLFLTPTKRGEKDFSTFIVTLTDAYDTENRLTIRVNASPEGINHKVAYTAAGAPEQLLAGYEYAVRRLHQGDSYGYASSLDFYGLPNRAIDKDLWELSYDYATKELHGAKYQSFPTLICDFDSPYYFADPWTRGFTTGEVFLSIRAEELQKETAEFVVTAVAGHDLSATELHDGQGPQITVDFDGYDPDDLPASYVGQSYPVFAAAAYDPYATDCNVYARAFYDDGGIRAQTEIVDGRFTTEKAGRYFLEYSATDGWGNRSVRTVDVRCLDGENKPRAQTAADRIETCEVGTRAPIAAIAVSGGSGRLTVSTAVIRKADGQSVDTADDTFTPMYDGEYLVRYTVTDFLAQTAQVEYTVTAAASGVPQFEERPALPPYLLAGKRYRFPAVRALCYDGAGGVTVQAAALVVTDDAGMHVGREYTVPANAAGGRVTLQYTARGDGGYARIVEEIAVVSVAGENGSDISKYFVGGGATLTADKSHLYMQATGNGEKSTFVNLLDPENFRLVLNLDREKAAFSAFTITLTDAVNEDEQLTIALSRADGKKTAVSVNGVSYGTATIDFAGGEDVSVVCSAGGKRIVLGDGALSFDVEGFECFSSGRVSVALAFDGVRGTSAVLLKYLCNQPLTAVGRDLIKPEIWVDEAVFRGTQAIGSTVCLPQASAFDVLDPYVAFTATVTAPDGKAVVSNLGERLDGVAGDKAYTFTLGAYGFYTVTYEAIDGAGRKQTASYALQVFDDVPPVLEVKGKLPSSVKSGTTVTLPEATVTDNFSETCSLYVCCKSPDGVYAKVEDRQLSCTQKGVYTVLYVATDLYGNKTVVDFAITVA